MGLRYITSQQRVDGSFERSWSLSEAQAIFRCVLVMRTCEIVESTQLLESIQTAKAKALNYLRNSQNSDGGWGHQLGYASDVISTSYSMIALSSLGDTETLRRGLHYLMQQQDEEGKFVSIPDQAAPRLLDALPRQPRQHVAPRRQVRRHRRDPVRRPAVRPPAARVRHRARGRLRAAALRAEEQGRRARPCEQQGSRSESVDTLRRRTEEAAKHIDLDRLAIEAEGNKFDSYRFDVPGSTLSVASLLRLTVETHSLAYDVHDDGTVSHGRRFADMPSDTTTNGVPDGMKVDREGRVYCTGPGGIWVFTPAGKRIGIIRFPEQAVNFAFGERQVAEVWYLAADCVAGNR
ncbi:MAG: hypothetical protein HC778_03130 [Chamaesiphon sp. CSU_1_12]|nr:hypothetical protein [Chamaesiphon sp. CSU_1_12]